MRNLALMWGLAGCLLGCGGGGDSDSLTWYCGPEKKPHAVKAVLKNGTLTVRGKGAVRDYMEPHVIVEPWGPPYKEAIKPYRNKYWPPWSFTLEYDSTVSITDVVIEKGVTYIGDLAFGRLPGLKSITIPASVYFIGDEALGGCKAAWYDTCAICLISITIATDNPYYSFEDGILFNKNKTTLIQYLRDEQQDTYTIPNNVKIIEDRAFGGCRNLKSVTIPGSVKTIGYIAFAYCKNLTSVTVQNPKPPHLGADVFKRIDYNPCLYVPESSINAYQLADGWKEFKCIKAIESAPE